MQRGGKLSGAILRDPGNRIDRQSQLEISFFLEVSSVFHEQRPIKNERQKAMVGGIRARERPEDRLGEETHINRGIRVGDGHIPREDTPLSEVERSPKLFHAPEILEDTSRGVTDAESLRPPSMSRETSGKEHHSHRATREADPLGIRAPRATRHPGERAEESSHKRGRK